MRRLIQFTLSSLFVLVLGGVCLATDVPKLTGVFNDETNIISAAKRADITAFLKEQEARTSNQIVVLVVPTIGGKDVDIAEYAGNVFNTWKLGQADKNNGVLVTFARREGKMRITVGNGLQGALPDLRANQFLEGQEIQSLLKATKFGSAILATVKMISKAVGDEYQPASTPVPEPAIENTSLEQEDGHFGLFLFVLVVVGVGMVIYFMFRSNSKDEENVVYSSSPSVSPRRHRGRGGHAPSRRRSSESSNPSQRGDDEDDGFLTGVIVGSVLGGGSSNDSGKESSWNSPSRDPDPPASAPDPEPYSGGGGESDTGGSETSFDGGDGSGAD